MTRFGTLSISVSAVTGVATVAALRLHDPYRLGRIRRLQRTKLLRLLKHAFRNVPYYREMFTSVGFKPESLKSIDDLPRVPELTKAGIQLHYDELLDQKYTGQKRSSLIIVRTTGSSGTPLQVLLSPKEYFQSLSHVLYGFLTCGANIRDTFVHLHVPQGPPGHFAFERLGILRQLHIDLRAGEKVVLNELRSARSPVVYSFPSFLQLMANFLLQHNVSPPRVKMIVSNGETLTLAARERIRRAFRCPVYDSYGAAEIFRIACECRHQRLHILPDTSIVELDERTKEADGSAEVIITPLYLRAMPLIRYRLGDRIIPSNERCDCGSAWPIITRIVGRSDDFLTLSSGRKISARAINIFESIPGIAEYQVLQETRSKFVVRVRPSGSIGEDTCNRITKAIADGCAPDAVDVRVETVDAIQRSATGKLRSVVSEVKG